MIKNIVVVSDTHIGCKLGLCKDEFRLDEGGVYQGSRFQKEVYSKWLEFWNEWVPKVTKNQPYVMVINGDVVDGVHHGSTTQITHNMQDQRRLAVETLEPIVSKKKCKGLYMVRGTEVHVGKSACDEETIARDLGAIPSVDGVYANWEIWMRAGYQNRLIHFSHHIGTTGSAAYESTAVHKELVEAYNESGRWGDEPPAIVVRSHRHRSYKIEIPNKDGLGIAFCTPGWQLKTPFTFRIPLARAGTPQVGGFVIRDGDEDGLYTRQKVWRIPRSPEVRI